MSSHTVRAGTLVLALAALFGILFLSSAAAASTPKCATSAGGSVTTTSPAYTTSKYYPGYYKTVTTYEAGYYTTARIYHAGYNKTVKTWVSGHWGYPRHWHSGYYLCVKWQFVYTGDWWRCLARAWHPSWYTSTWYPGHYTYSTVWVPPGYTTSTVWVPPGYTTSTVWVPPGYTYSTVWVPPGYTTSSVWVPGHTVVTQHPAHSVTTSAPPESVCMAVGPYAPDPSAPVAITGLAEHFWITGDTSSIVAVDWTFGSANYPFQGSSVWYSFPVTGLTPYSAQITWADGATATVGGTILVKQVQSVAG